MKIDTLELKPQNSEKKQQNRFEKRRSIGPKNDEDYEPKTSFQNLRNRVQKMSASMLLKFRVRNGEKVGIPSGAEVRKSCRGRKVLE